jgi:hypothetical protein
MIRVRKFINWIWCNIKRAKHFGSDFSMVISVLFELGPYKFLVLKKKVL